MFPAFPGRGVRIRDFRGRSSGRPSNPCWMRCKRSRGSAHGSERVSAALPWRAFYWECPALTAATLSDPFECVALEAPSLIGLAAEPDAFRAHLDATPPGSLVAVFPNLSGDASWSLPQREMTGEDIRISPPSCALRRKRKLRRSFRPWPRRVCAHAGKGLHGSAPLAMAWHGCTAVWTGGRSTTAMRHIARSSAEIRRRAYRTCSSARSGRIRRRRAWRAAARRCCAWMS